MTQVVFICRGSASIGLGHVMRCRTIAAAMTASADVHVILLGDPAVCTNLPAPDIPFTHAEGDVDALHMACGMNADVVVFDLLEFDPEAFDTLRQGATTVCLSPIFNLLSRVDLAFTRAASPVHEQLIVEGHPVIRAGSQYATISPHCRRVETGVYRRGLALEPLAVAISMGGADAPNNTLRILEVIRHVPAAMLFWVMLGEGYTHSYQRLIDCLHADGRHEIILAKTNSSMWRILGGCSVAILAGGITTFEAAYAGIPSIIALGDDRDRFLIRELIDTGASTYAGAPLEAALEGIVTALVYLNENREKLLRMHARGRQLLDNQGPHRVANEILEFHRSAVNTKEMIPCALV